MVEPALRYHFRGIISIFLQQLTGQRMTPDRLPVGRRAGVKVHALAPLTALSCSNAKKVSQLMISQGVR